MVTAGLVTAVAAAVSIMAAVMRSMAAGFGAAGDAAIRVVGVSIAGCVGCIGFPVVLMIAGLCAAAGRTDRGRRGRGRESGSRAHRHYHGSSHKNRCDFFVHHLKVPHFYHFLFCPYFYRYEWNSLIS